MNGVQSDGKRLGMVLAGSLSDGVQVRLDPTTSIEEIKVGALVTIDGVRNRFIGQISGITLGATDPMLMVNPPDVSDEFIFNVVTGTSAYGSIEVQPNLIIRVADDPLATLEGPQPAKTVPSHFSSVNVASEHDIQTVFGTEDDKHFWIGNPLDMETRLCLDMSEFVKRSNGVFGKSGTGKTFLTRLLLAGVLQSGEASNLVFDMHSEYGWKGGSETRTEVKGLKQLFSSRVAVFSLDHESSRRRGLTPDYNVRIGYEEVEPEDIQILRDTLGLSTVAADAAFSLQRHFGQKGWLKQFLDLKGQDAVRELATDLNVNQGALITLQNRLARFERFTFMDNDTDHGSVTEILRYLDRGIHVVLEFGRYGNNFAAYVLVANLLTRRIYDRYVELKETASGQSSKEPRPLVITIEEAHKFLTSDIADQTIFGTIAREMRKYNVTLLVVDQRPSGIDPEVMSQLGTKITCLLDSEKDVDAVLAGSSGSRKLRSVISRLESKQQALAFGHALPMPVVIKVRDYGTPESYKELGWRDPADLKAQVDRDVEDLFGPDDAS